MRADPIPVLRPLLAPAAAALAIAGLAVPAAAQPPSAYDHAYDTSVEEVVIAGRRGPDGRPSQLSRVISIRDLDLATEAGRDVLRWRIRDTARGICRELGEPAFEVGPLVGSSCQERAVRSARPQMRLAIAQARARPYAYSDVRDPYGRLR